MYKRNIKPKLIKALGSTPVILLSGARQTGKTTLMREVAGFQDFSYVTFDDYTELSAAKNDPMGYLAQIKKPVILDEIQRVPELFLPMKKDVDEHRFAGRYALTGSANPLLIPRVGDSLAGRIEILPLYPLSQGEIRGRKEIWIDTLFEESFDLSSHTPIEPDAFWHQFFVGGYPEMHFRGKDPERLFAWCKSYITMILERDVQDLSKIEGLRNFPNLLRLLASRTSGLLNIAELSRSIGLSTSTLQRYLELLRATYLIYLQPAWLNHRGKRITKSPKVYVFDTGLLSFLIGLNPQGVDSQSHLMGPLLETFVVSEILKQQSWSSLFVQSFHFRSTPYEVDIVLENAAGQIVGVEIKYAAQIQPSDFKGLEELQREAGKKFLRGLVLYSGGQTAPFGKNFYALPISSLWERSMEQ